ncbi:MAG: peroxidase family protein, partial [Planctomycetota bacterium]
DETPGSDPAEPFDINVPAGDPYFDPFGTGSVTIPLSRSLRIDEAGTQSQVNLITAYIDASNVYGSEHDRADELRTLDGTGRLKTSDGDLLPYNDAGMPNAPSTSDVFFLAGDIRANEQNALTAMHTLFVREHNHWADEIRRQNRQANRQGGPGGPNQGGGPNTHGHSQRRSMSAANLPRRLMTGDEIYELARAIVGAEMQVITYREFLPALLGPNALSPYLGYQPQVDPTISNEFATASYRFGHSMLSPVLRRLNANGNSISNGDISLADAFFNPQEIVTNGIAPLLRGLAAQEAQAVDHLVIDEVRNFLFGPPGSGGFDLPSLNIQRGRDHGLNDYNTTRTALGLSSRTSFAEVNSDPAVERRLAAVYRSVDDVDLWVGGLCEPPVPGAAVGETIRAVLVRQFEALRDGDRFWYENYLSPGLVNLVEQQTLSRIIRRNTSIGAELPMDVFHVQ